MRNRTNKFKGSLQIKKIITKELIGKFRRTTVDPLLLDRGLGVLGLSVLIDLDNSFTDGERDRMVLIGMDKDVGLANAPTGLTILHQITTLKQRKNRSFT